MTSWEGPTVQDQDNPVAATYDVVAADYAGYFPDTAAEASLDLALLDHFVTLVSDRLARPHPQPESQLAAGITDARGAGHQSPIVLDAGCGAGRIADYLTERQCDVVGVDLSLGMLAMARHDHPALPTAAGSIVDLPIADESVDGALYWYSTIHLADSLLPSVVSESARVLRPGGYALFAFQSGQGVQDVGPAYSIFGHDVRLMRYGRTAEQYAALAVDIGFEVTAQLCRGPVGAERDGQGFVIVRRPG